VASAAAAEIRPVPDQAEYERRFRQAGLPLFIEDFSPATDIFNRAVPLLGLVFIGEVLGAIDLNWSPAANVAAALGGLAILLLAIALSNRARGRPFRSIPRTVGRPELAGFVLIPALLPLIFGGQWRSAIVTALANLALLFGILGVVGFGLLSILRWAVARLLGQLRRSLELLSKALPLLLLFALLIFPTTEVWQISTEIPPLNAAILVGLLLAIGTTFLAVRIPDEVASLEREAVEGGPELQPRQRVNVGLVLFVSQALQVIVVSIAIGVFFVIFGMLTVDPKILESWIGSGGHTLVTVHLGGHDLTISEELLRVSGGIAAVTGLYFAISMLTDEVYRREFLDELTDGMRQTFRDRGEYLRLRGADR
jgi:hypothetical protein